MWNKPLKVYQGVDNAYELIIHDFDQQPVPVTAYTARFRAIDASSSYVLDKPVAIKSGMVNRLDLQLLKADLANLELGFYHYSITLDDGETERPLYFEQNGTAVGQMELLGGPFQA